LRIILDTNVLVAGLLNPSGPPGLILQLVRERQVELALDERILAEYAAILQRAKFGFSRATQREVPHELVRLAVLVNQPEMGPALPDEDDRPFLEVALAAGAHAIVTGNLKHFPPDICAPVRIIAPAEFIRLWVS